MRLNANDCRELRNDLDELLEAVRELKHELGSDNEEIESNGKRNRKKKHNSGVAYNKKNKANNRRNH
jgi:Sec-independent protein translocase protein TatA